MKKKVVKTKAKQKQKQKQSQKQIVNITIGDKVGKVAKAKRRTAIPVKKSMVSSGPTIVMNQYQPPPPIMPVQTAPTSIYPPIIIQQQPEYTSVDYLDDSERGRSQAEQEQMRISRLRLFENEPMMRQQAPMSIYSDSTYDNLSSVSDSTDHNLSSVSNSTYDNLSSVSNSTYKSNQKMELGNIFQNIQGSAQEVINPQYREPIQLSEPQGASFENFERNRQTENARVARMIQQLEQGAGGNVPTQLLLSGIFQLEGEPRRRFPTKNQRLRLYEAGRPYTGDEDGVGIIRRRKPTEKK